jgi:transcriptional regulator with XRE-family HTH domain
MTITPDQCRAGRQLLGWSRSDLAGHSGVSPSTIGNYEQGKKRASVLDLSVVRYALEYAGVIFTPENSDGPGVKLRKPAK